MKWNLGTRHFTVIKTKSLPGNLWEICPLLIKPMLDDVVLSSLLARKMRSVGRLSSAGPKALVGLKNSWKCFSASDMHSKK